MVPAGTRPTVLLEIMLPGSDGFELRRDSDPLDPRPDRPFGQPRHRGALGAGADDYMVKPAVPEELAARIGALLRRPNRTTTPTARFAVGDLEIEPENGVVRQRGVPLPIT